MGRDWSCGRLRFGQEPKFGEKQPQVGLGEREKEAVFGKGAGDTL